jgi:hypothetical protein
MPVSQSVACRCRSRASSSSQAARKRTKRSAGLSRVVCRRHLRSVGLTGEQIGYERHGGRPKRERQLQGHPRRRSSATARGYGKLNCPPYLEIRRGERTTVGFPILSTCNPDISSHQQRLRYTMPCRMIPMNDKLPVGVAPLLIDRLLRVWTRQAVNISTDPNRRSSAARKKCFIFLPYASVPEGLWQQLLLKPHLHVKLMMVYHHHHRASNHLHVVSRVRPDPTHRHVPPRNELLVGKLTPCPHFSSRAP